MKKGKFIVLEGINGCGKGVQFDRLHSYMRDSGKAVPIFTTGEPNDFDENGRKAREMLARDGDPYENAQEAVGYFAKNRLSHNNVFGPLLDEGVNVISDRYWHSNFAFQHAQEVPYEDVASVNAGFRVPDLTLILDVPVEVAFERLHGRDGAERRKFDSDRDFLERVRENYLELKWVLPDLIRDDSMFVVHGNAPVDEVWENVKAVYDSVCNNE